MEPKYPEVVNMRCSAVILAGYNNRRAVEKYSRIVAENYHETYIETGYKPLREFSLHHHGKHVTKPLIQFTLDELLKMDQISDIVLIGNKTLLENKLLPVLENQEKPWKILDQKTPFSGTVKERFVSDQNPLPVESIAGNIIKAYCAAQSFEKGEPALFVASDSPLTDRNFMENFLTAAFAMRERADVVMPAVPVGLLKDKMGRRPLLLINDTGISLPCRTDHHGRCGFRLSSLLLANPANLDVPRINDIYSMRKALSPKIQIRIFRICRDLGYPSIYRKYFRMKNLTLQECENILSSFLRGRVKSLPIEGEGTTYDYDGTKKELKRLTRMLKRKI